MNQPTDRSLLRGVSIFLVGMMGSGKSTIGRMLARRLHYRFFDTDVLVEKVTGETIAGIFERSGEEEFRAIETKVLAELSSCTKSVIATGGGIVIKPLNWSYLRHSLIIWLDAPIEVLVKRLRNDFSRPLLRDTELENRLHLLLQERRSLYEEADLRVIIQANDTPEKTVDRILKLIPSVLQTSANNS
jgi:shikimate kinase